MPSVPRTFSARRAFSSSMRRRFSASTSLELPALTAAAPAAVSHVREETSALLSLLDFRHMTEYRSVARISNWSIVVGGARRRKGAALGWSARLHSGFDQKSAMLRLPQCPASVARRIAPMSAVSRTRFVKAFPNWVVTLHRTTGKQTLRPNEYVFKVPPEMTKFDIRQYLEKLYSVKVEAISTVRTDGAWRAGARSPTPTVTAPPPRRSQRK